MIPDSVSVGELLDQAQAEQLRIERERDRLRAKLGYILGAIEGWESTVILALREDARSFDKMPEEPRGTFEFLLERLKAEGDDLRALLKERI